MRRLLLICLGAMFALAGMASARGPANEFAAGSAKTEADTVIGNEHASFDVHNVPGTSCEASGYIVYKTDLSPLTGGPLEFEAKLDRLVLGSPDVPEEAGGAAFTGPIQRVKQGDPNLKGQTAVFDAFDSGLGGGTGDLFQLENILEIPPVACLLPMGGHPIDQGNIIIKATGLLP
jgi:hypothetical protein